MFRRLLMSKKAKKEALKDRLQQAVASNKEEKGMIKNSVKGLVVALAITAALGTTVQANEINKVTKNNGTTYDCTCGHLSWMGIVEDPCQQKETSLLGSLFGEEYVEATRKANEPEQKPKNVFVRLFNSILSIFGL